MDYAVLHDIKKLEYRRATQMAKLKKPDDMPMDEWLKSTAKTVANWVNMAHGARLHEQAILTQH